MKPASRFLRVFSRASSMEMWCPKRTNFLLEASTR